MKLWENPAISGLNKRSPHVPLRSYPNVAIALEYYRRPLGEGNARQASPAIQFLDHEAWGFKLYARPEDVPDKFWDHDLKTVVCGHAL